MSTVSQLGSSPPPPASVPSALRASGAAVYMCGEWMRILNRLHVNPTAMRTDTAPRPIQLPELDGSRSFMTFEPFRVICICGGALEPGAPMSMRIPTTSFSQNSCARALHNNFRDRKWNVTAQRQVTRPCGARQQGAVAGNGRSQAACTWNWSHRIKTAASGREIGPPMAPTCLRGASGAFGAVLGSTRPPPLPIHPPLYMLSPSLAKAYDSSALPTASSPGQSAGVNPKKR